MLFREEQQRTPVVWGLLSEATEIPSHSQNNERAVSNTTEAVEKAIGHDNQKALLIETDKSRQEMPTQSTKSIFLEL